MTPVATSAPKIFRAATYPRERFYFSCDQRRSAGVAPHSWESDEPVVDRERWKVRKVTHHGFKVTLRTKFAGNWRTKAERTMLELGEACMIAREWVKSQEGQAPA